MLVQHSKEIGKEQSGGYRATIRDYGSGMVEVSYAFVAATSPVRVSARGTSENLAENLERADHRATSRVRRLCMTGHLDHMLTLTFRENITELDQASGHLEAFVRVVHSQYPNWAYVAVAERQKRGCWHFHLGVRGWQDVKFLRASWLAVVGEGGGNVDVSAPARGKGAWEIPWLASYLSKYITKNISTERALNEHRFRASIGIKVPEEIVTLAARSSIAAGQECAAIFDRLGSAVAYVWSGKDGMAGWMCSWG